MPFIAQDEEEKQQQAQQPGAQSSVISTGGSKPIGPQSSGSYANLNKYLEANKPQAQQMGQQVANTVEQQGQQAQQDINKFQSSVAPAPKVETKESINSRLSAPTQNADYYKQLQTSGGYTGPKTVQDVSGFQQATKSAQKAQESAKALQSEQGRMGLVEQQYARPAYSLGQKRLDTSLVSRTPEARTGFEQTAQKWQGINDVLSGAQNQAQQQIQQNVNTAEANKALTQQTQNEYVQNLKNQFQQQADQYNQQQKSLQDKFNAEVNSKQFSPEVAKLLGVDTTQNSFGTDLRKYFNPDMTQAAAGDLATAEQRTNWQNLMNLIGGNEQLSNQQLRGTQFDKAGFEAERAQRGAEDVKFALERAKEAARRQAEAEALRKEQERLRNASLFGRGPSGTGR